MSRKSVLAGLLCVLGLLVLFIYLNQNELAHIPVHETLKRFPVDSTLQLVTDGSGPAVVIYNRIPKTGSTSFMSVLYSLCEKNKFSAIYVNVSSKSHTFSYSDEVWFVRNVSLWIERKPAIYHGHFPFTNFHRFGFRDPVYINILRPPLERLVSYYYFVRYGDNFRPYLKRSRMGDQRSFDECVLEKGSDCHPQRLWLQIPYFCGTFPQCWTPGSSWALEQAKANLVRYYYLVGITDQIDVFIGMLEHSLPHIFHGASEIFKKDGGIHVRQTKAKKPLQPETVTFFHKSEIWKLENEFYEFAETIFKAKAKHFGDSKTVYQKLKPE